MIFTNELLDLQERLETSIDIFAGNGHLIIRKGLEHEIRGIIDTVPNYFYIDFSDGASQLIFEAAPGGSAHFVTGNFKMVARTTGYTLDSVAENILAILFDSKCEVTSLSTDEEFIYVSETGEALKDEIDLYLIEFSMSKHIYPKPNCVPLNCKEC